MATDMISIPITLEQLITAVQQLQSEERTQVSRSLVQAGLRSDLTALIQELYAQPAVDDITDAVYLHCPSYEEDWYFLFWQLPYCC